MTSINIKGMSSDELFRAAFSDSGKATVNRRGIVDRLLVQPTRLRIGELILYNLYDGIIRSIDGLFYQLGKNIRAVKTGTAVKFLGAKDWSKVTFSVIDRAVLFDEETILKQAITENNDQRRRRNWKKAQLSVQRWMNCIGRFEKKPDIEHEESLHPEAKLNREETAHADQIYKQLRFAK